MSGAPFRLTDHRAELERRAYFAHARKEIPQAFGNFIAGLAQWDWFINPFTFRNLSRAEEARLVVPVSSDGNVVRYSQDPRLVSWRPPSRYALRPGPPVPDAAFARITQYFSNMQASTGGPIGWVLAEEFGRMGGRYHCHALVTGVAHLRRDVWWDEAHRRFGRTRIEPFDPRKAAAFYTAKYAAKQLGGLHFGGTLAGINLSAARETNLPIRHGVVVARSANVPNEFFHLTLPRRHR